MHILKNFKNLNGIAYAKSEIIDNIVNGGSIILNADDKFFNFFKLKSLKKTEHSFFWNKKRVKYKTN